MVLNATTSHTSATSEIELDAVPVINTIMLPSTLEQTGDDRLGIGASFYGNIVRDNEAPAISRPPTQFTPINTVAPQYTPPQNQFTPINLPKVAFSHNQPISTNTRQQEPFQLPIPPCDDQRSASLPPSLPHFVTPPPSNRPLEIHALPHPEPELIRQVIGVDHLVGDNGQPLDIGVQVPPAFQPIILDSSISTVNAYNVRDGQQSIPQHNTRWGRMVKIGPYMTPEGLDPHICRYLVRRWLKCESSKAKWEGTAAEINQYKKSRLNGPKCLAEALPQGSPHDQNHVYETPTTYPAFQLQVNISRDSSGKLENLPLANDPNLQSKEIKTEDQRRRPQPDQKSRPPTSSRKNLAARKGRLNHLPASETRSKPKPFTFSTSLTSENMLVDQPTYLIIPSPEKSIPYPSLNNSTNTEDHSKSQETITASMHRFLKSPGPMKDEYSNVNYVGPSYQSVGKYRDSKRMRLSYGSISRNREETIELEISPKNYEIAFDNKPQSSISAAKNFEQTIHYEDDSKTIQGVNTSIKIEDDSEAETVIEQSLTDDNRLKEFTTAEGKNFYVTRTTQWVLSGIE